MEKNRATLKKDFSTGKTITEDILSDLFDSTYNKIDDDIPIKKTDILRLEAAIVYLAKDDYENLNDYLTSKGFDPIEKD